MEEPLNSLSRQELDRLLESVRAQPPTVPTHCRRQRPGIAPDESGFDPTAPPSEPSLQQQRRQTARQFFGAMLLTLMLMGGCFGALLVQESYRQVGMGSPTHPGDLRPAHRVWGRVCHRCRPHPGGAGAALLVSGPAGALPAAPGAAPHRPAPAGRAAPA